MDQDFCWTIRQKGKHSCSETDDARENANETFSVLLLCAWLGPSGTWVWVKGNKVEGNGKERPSRKEADDEKERVNK
jgi:hypothetical protein